MNRHLRFRGSRRRMRQIRMRENSPRSLLIGLMVLLFIIVSRSGGWPGMRLRGISSCDITRISAQRAHSELETSPGPVPRLVSNVVDTDFGPLRSSMRHRQIQPRLLVCKQRSACTGRCVHARQPCHRRRHSCVEDVDEALAAREINALALWIEEHVVSISDDVECGDLFARCRVEHQHLCRLATPDE